MDKSKLFCKEENALGNRLLEARKVLNLSQPELCRRLSEYGIEITPTSVSKWELGKTYPDPLQLFALCDIYGIEFISDLSGKSRLNARGMERLMAYRQDLLDCGNYRNTPCVLENLVSFRHYDSCVSAGPGNDAEDFFTLKDRNPEEIPAGAEWTLTISGDSMEPAYLNGQDVYVLPCEELQQGDIGIFILNGCSYMKKYKEQIPDDPESYTDSAGVLHLQPVLVSLNRKYDPIVVRRDDSLKIAGKVLGIAT